ncbi:MAG TPA: malto-oligosyltrehalose trehalohydrolase [Chloroflexota bacterium]|nr:malto-oligosyltrehalose trehalohydrolase [Chloroflexota bacterium]
MSNWRLPLGANLVPRGAGSAGVEFRVWAPKARRVDVELQTPEGVVYVPLAPVPKGLHVRVVEVAEAGSRYRYRLDDGASFPDPWSRSQPEGVHGPSEVVAPDFAWTDQAWPGLDPERLVIYELHVGTYTPEGTFAAIMPRLAELRRLGVTTLELMPVAEFPGRWNWGYDGVDLFAPSRNYGGVTGLKQLVDAAHREGLGVLLDVVYNHFGPDGNYLRAFSDDYFTDRYGTPWGEAINYDGENRERVRELVVQNACYWLVEYHLDGLRLDATHAIYDASPVHLLAELNDTARAAVGAGRRPIIIAEDGRNEVKIIRPRPDGFGLDGIWADDFHHLVHTMLTGEHEGYYADYPGTAPALARAVEEGLYYQGEASAYRGGPRGTRVTDEPARAFVFCLQNHDQVGNRALGERLGHLIDRDRLAVAATLLLLAPETPLIFMGEEFAASSPFLYFTDHEPGLGRRVTEGRRREFAGFSAFANEARREQIPDPQAESTFLRSRLHHAEREVNAKFYGLYQELLRLRAQDAVFAHPDRTRTTAVAIGDRCVVVRRWNGSGRRLIVANFGTGITVSFADPAFGGWLGYPRHALLSTATYRFGQIERRAHPRRNRLAIPWGAAIVWEVDGASD